MKRAFSAAVFSAFLVLAVPQAAFADHAADHRGDGGKSEQAAGPQPDGASNSEGAQADGAPPPDQPYADRQSQGDDEEEFLLF